MRTRILRLLETDAVRAKEILSGIGLEIDQVPSLFERVGFALRLKSQKFPELDDPAHPAFAAARFVLIQADILSGDPMSLQIGRLWGYCVRGMTVKEITKAGADRRLHLGRGGGGRPASDLAKSFKAVLSVKPEIGLKDVSEFLRSEVGQDLSNAQPEPLVLIRDVELVADKLLFLDSKGREQSVKITAARRLLQRLRQEAT